MKNTCTDASLRAPQMLTLRVLRWLFQNREKSFYAVFGFYFTVIGSVLLLGVTVMARSGLDTGRRVIAALIACLLIDGGIWCFRQFPKATKWL